MIWNPHHPQVREPTGLSVDLVEELRALCGSTLGGAAHQLEDVVQAVAATLEDGGGVEAPDPKLLITLASKALWSIGEARAARRLGLLGSGMLRQADWSVAGDNPMWVLDVLPLSREPGVLLEMQLCARLDLILDCMADVWDDSEGNGVLGLLHLDAFRRAGRGRRGSGAAWAAEIMAACGARLGAIGRGRGWVRPPSVIALDLRV